MRELILSYTQGNTMFLHLIFLGLLVFSSGLLLASSAAVLVQRNGGGAVARGSAWVGAVLNAAAMWLAVDCVDLGIESYSYRLLLNLYVGFLALVSFYGVMSAASARTGTLIAGSQGMVGLGTLIYLLLLGAVPNGADPAWELSHLTEFILFATSGFFMLLTVSFASSREQRGPSVILAGITASLGVVVLLQAFAHHPGPRPSVILPSVVPPVACMGWMVWLMFGRTGASTGALGRSLRSAAKLIWGHPLFVAGVVAAPVFMASAAFLLGGSGSARAVSRVSLGGLSITPGLVTPFLFAIALGLLVGRERWRWKGRGGIVLTIGMAALLFAQKEIGNIAVIFLVASMVYLVARGTILHLLAGGALAGAGVVAAYQLAPIFSFIPFTVRERIHLWLGGAELLRRGGHLVTATHATYKLGGFWGIGVHENPGVNIPRLVIAIHTDFPLVILGLFGGCVLLSVYIAFFSTTALCMLDTIRGLGFEGDTRRARWQAPILAGLFAVPIGSTVINLAGAITQVTPFTGVPVMFISYSSIFLLGTFSIVAAFVLTGNRAATLGVLHDQGKKEVSKGLEVPKTISISSSRPPVEMPQDPNLLVTRQVHSEYAPTTEKTTGWRRWLSFAGWSLFLEKAGRTLRLRDVNGGVLIVCLVMVSLSGVFVRTLYVRYTDTTRYHGHPRLTDQELVIEPQGLAEGNPAKGGWRVVSSTKPSLVGELKNGEPFQLGPLDMVLRGSSVLVRGGCFSEDKMKEGVTFGFEGMLDAPPLPFVDNAVDSTMERLHVVAEKTNDVVLPFGDIALRHVRVRMVGEDAFAVEEASPAGVYWDGLDREGHVKPRPLEATFGLGEGFRIGTRRPRSFYVRKDQDRICISMKRGAIFQYSLSPDAPTRLGNMALLRRQFATRTTDFVYAQDVKAAAEAGILRADGRDGSLSVIAHDKATRETWDDETKRRFYRVFRILKIKRDDGSIYEALAWSRPFYGDGDRRFSPTRELDAFIIHDGNVLGLTNSYRFSNALPVLYKRNDPKRNGLLYDRYGEPLVERDDRGEVLVASVPGTTPIVGFDFRRRGIRDGLLRVFSRAMRGVEPVADVRDELDDRLQGKDRGPWGWDVMTTLDAEIQRQAHWILQDEVRSLYAKEPGTVHHASAVILGPRNEILAAVQAPAIEEIRDLDDALAYKKKQLESPMNAPALDAFHRRTTMGSTIKLLTMITAFRHKDDVLLKWKDGEWYINAEQDPANASLGRYAESGGALRSWRGQAIAPVHNYGRSVFGSVIPLRTLLIKSLNTGSAYMGLNVGKERYYQFFRDTKMWDVPRLELLPPQLWRDGAMGHLVERYPNDPAAALPVSLGAIPSWEKWTLSLTARLPLSGLSDYSSLNTALGVSVIAREGVYHLPRIVRGMRNRKTGEVITFPMDSGERIIEREDAETMQDYMRDVIRRGTGAGYRRGLPYEVWSDAGGKTGTGETVVPVNPNAEYSLKNKPKTRDNKAFVAVWPTSSTQPFVIAVVFEQVSHLDRGIAVRTSQRMMEAVRAKITQSHREAKEKKDGTAP